MSKEASSTIGHKTKDKSIPNKDMEAVLDLGDSANDTKYIEKENTPSASRIKKTDGSMVDRSSPSHMA